MAAPRPGQPQSCEDHSDPQPPDRASGSSVAWGSWNDPGFNGAAREEYEKASADLDGILNEVIAVAASGTAGR